MKSQQLKDLYFTAARPLAYMSHLVWKAWLSHGGVKRLHSKYIGKIWLNIGSGAKPYKRFLNIEGNVFRRSDMWLDLRNGLPFPNGSVDAIYACHVLEHFYPEELMVVLKECSRVLRPGGGMRILVPSLELAVKAYIDGNADFFTDFPRSYRTVGGRLVNFLFCDGQHRLACDFPLMCEVLAEAGFAECLRERPRQSRIFPQDVVEELEPPVGHIETSLVVEATKAAPPGAC